MRDSSKLPRAEYVSAWVDLMNVCDQFLIAGLRRKIGPDGDIRAAYRKWNEREMREHDRMMEHMISAFGKQGS